MRGFLLVQVLVAGCGRYEFGSPGQPSGYAAVVLADSPQLYWRFEEPPGAAVAVDSSGHGRNGLYFGNPILGVPEY
jgi:hypothetical protein